MNETDPSPLSILRHQLATAGRSAYRFRRLAEDIEAAGASQASLDSSRSISHADCQQFLDRYVSDELAELDVRTIYPQVWQHLQTCDQCWPHYDLLIDTLEHEQFAEPAARPRRSMPPLSFLSTSSVEEPWTSRLQAQIAGTPFHLSISISLSHLQKIFSPAQLLTVRSEESLFPATTYLLLTDTIPFGGQTLVVEVTAAPVPEQSEQIAIHSLITCSGELPANLWAGLTWADETRRSPVDPSGQTDFGRVSLLALQSGLGSFKIEFEVHEAADNDSDSTG
jgi:hypothetical protein